MIIGYDDLKLIINLEPGPWCLIECADQKMPKPDSDTELSEEVSYFIVFAFVGGMVKPIKYDTKENRDAHFEELRRQIMNERAQSQAVLPVRLHPAQANGRGVIESR
jgi:hypothetical protein